MKSLAELKSSPDVGLPGKPFPICVAGKLIGELEEADRLLFEAEQALAVEEAEAEARRNGEGKPRRQGEKSPLLELEKKAAAAAEVGDAIRARMEDHMVVMDLAGQDNGKWRQWATKHPARDEDDDPVGYQRDQRHAGGFCDIDALIADLGDFVNAYGDEPATDDWRDFVLANAAPGDLTRAASTVVGMHEQVVDLGKSRAAWRAGRKTSSDSE